MSEVSTKPLGRKAYGHIPHLPGSRLGPGDHCVHSGQARICTNKTRDKHDLVIIQEKLDGSCCSVAKVDGRIFSLGRSGYLAQTSPYEQHQLFAYWVRQNEARFDILLNEGERVVGEWMAQAHGTRYSLKHEPFVIFDLMAGQERQLTEEVNSRVVSIELPVPHILFCGPSPVDIITVMDSLSSGGFHGALDPAEGAVWRIERHGKVDFLAKYVRPDKHDGCYLPEVSGCEAIWNWRPLK